MKAHKVLLISMVIFGLLLGGVFSLQTTAAVVDATVKCTPPRVSLEDPIPSDHKITLTLPKPYDHEDINPSTLLVGGVVLMLEEDGWPKIKKKYFKFKVDGEELWSWVILPLMNPNGYPPATWVPIDITVTGMIYDGPEFAGTFTLMVRTEDHDNGLGIPPP